MSLNVLLEKWGRFFFCKMRPPFFFALLSFPILGVCLFLFLEQVEQEELEVRIARAARKEKIAFERKERKERFLSRYSQPSPYFLDKEIESLSLLEKEKEQLHQLLNHPAFPSSSAIQKRLHFIETNRLSFTEGNIRNSSKVKEVEEKLRQRVQMDEQDLQKTLAIIEDVSVGPFTPLSASPQMLIKELRLKKLETSLQTQVFEVDMALLKREFTK